MRILGIDYGTKRIGLAVADTDAAAVAVPRGTVAAADAIAALTAFCKRERISHLVVGLPVTLRGEEGAMADAARAFGRALADAAGISLHFVDERLTTASLPKEGVVSRDAASAAAVLQTWLDRRKSKAPSSNVK